MRKLVPAILAAGLLALAAARPASAGQIVSATGGITVNGKPASAAQPITLKAKDRVETGAGVTAVFRSDAGDESRIDPNSSVRHEGIDGGVEFLLVEKGVVTAAISGKTAVGSPLSWATAAEGGKSEVRIEVPGERAVNEGRFRSTRSGSWLQNGSNAVWVPENNSVTLTADSQKQGFLAFRTAQQNEGLVALRRTVSGGDIYTRVPRATGGSVSDWPGDRTRIENDRTSSKSTRIQVITEFGARGSAAIGPGTFALIDNNTGTVETDLDDLWTTLGDDAADYDPVESSDDASLTRRGRR